MDKIKEDKLGNILKNKDLIFITTVIYFAIITLYELFYCNFNFFTGKIENYNFSLYRIIMYIIIYLIYYKFKDEFSWDISIFKLEIIPVVAVIEYFSPRGLPIAKTPSPIFKVLVCLNFAML